MGTRKRRGAVLLTAGLTSLTVAVSAPGALAATPSYVQAPGTAPTVDTIADGATVSAPYNLSQGVTSFNGLSYSSYPSGDLVPTYTSGGTSTPATAAGATAEPNVAVYPSQSGAEPFISGFGGTPGPLSGYCGASYSDTWDTGTSATTGNPNETATPVSQPAGTSLPFAPYYFPYIVRNSNGSLTGYFDWRPKDADEAIVSATSTDNGKTWTASGKALEQNPGYCPSGDTNDDGLGHPYVAALDSNSASPTLYTLQRADGDYTGTNLDAYSVSPSAANPLGGLPASTSVGVDPNTFAAGSTTVAATGGTAVSIPVTTLGGDASGGNSTTATDSTGNTLTQLDPTGLPNGAAQYEDLTGTTPGSGVTPPIITCSGTTGSTGGTGLNTPALTGCTSSTATPVNISSNDDLVEVIGTASQVVLTGTITKSNPTGTPAATIPVGPQSEAQNAGDDIVLNLPSANSNTLSYLLNANAPNRYYINGAVVYCVQGNAEPTTMIETCTTTASAPVPVTSGAATSGTPITADPAIPSAGANYTGGPAAQTNGLIAPDGIIGPLPTSANASWGEPSTGKVVLYTEKKVNYFIEGGINGTETAANSANYINYKTASGSPLTLTTKQTGSSSALETGFVNTPGSTPTDYNISGFPTQAEPLPNSGSFNVYVGAETNSGGAEMVTMTCTGWGVNSSIADLYNPNQKTLDLINCTSANSTDILNAGHQGNWVAGPGAAIETNNSGGNAILTQIGEGKAIKSSQAQKLFGNNEDYEVVRAAYTTDGVNFTDLGAISGSSSGAPTLGSVSGAGNDTGAYSDISNPYQQESPAGTNANSVAVGSVDPASPEGDSPANLPLGSKDTTELRWPGARGTIITNADGSIGMFLSGAWASDGDSDAFNQIFYTQSSDGGKDWSVPTVVQSTDYTFAASAAQDNAPGTALGVSAYYSGRAYDPTVVANPDGTLTMVFAGYRLPAPVKAAGTPLGTNSSAPYCSGTAAAPTTAVPNPSCGGGTPVVGQTDPALYRNILTETLWPNVGTQQAPTVTTGTASAVTNTTAKAAGDVQTNEPDTTVAIVFGTSPSNLNRSVSAGTVNAASASQAVSATLGGLAAGTTYYYAVQATNYSGTTTGSIGSFTTTGGTTPTTTVTTPGSTVTTPGATVTTPGTTTVAETSPEVQRATRYETSTVKAGNQLVSVEIPNPGICLVPSAKLRVGYQSALIRSSTGTKETFIKAEISLDGKLRAVTRIASRTFELSLSGLKKGTHVLHVASTYHYKAGKKTETAVRVQNLNVKVC